MDPNISELMSTARPEKLLKNDGTIVTQLVKSVAVPKPGMAKANRAFDTGTKIFNFKSFLSANAMRSTNSLDGLDDCSSNNSTTGGVGPDHRLAEPEGNRLRHQGFPFCERRDDPRAAHALPDAGHGQAQRGGRDHQRRRAAAWHQWVRQELAATHAGRRAVRQGT